MNNSGNFGRGKQFGTVKGVVGTNYVGTGGSNNGDNFKRKSPKGYYYTAFVKEYAGLSERDFELKLDYGIDLVAQYKGIAKNAIQLRKKTEKQTITSIDSVFYVRRGQDIIGKLSIRAQRRFNDRTLIFVYLEKDLKRKELRGYQPKPDSYVGKTKSQLRKANRKRKKRKSGTTY